MGKATSLNKELTPTELSVVISIAIHMHDYIMKYNFNAEVQVQLKNLKKKHFGIQQFLVSNFLGFNTKLWYTPEEIKRRFENHMGIKLNRKNELLTEDPVLIRSGIDSRDVNKVLNKLKKDAGLKNVTGIKEIRRVSNQKMEFGGFPSIWKFPNTKNIINSIIAKQKIFKTVYFALLESGLLYHYWKYQFKTILGCLKEVNDNDIQKCSHILRNFFAGTPEKTKDKLSLEVYIRKLIVLRNNVKTLNIVDLEKLAGKMAGYILKNQPAYSIFELYSETDS